MMSMRSSGPDPVTGAEAFANASTTVVSHQRPLPVAIAPLGAQGIFHPEGEVAVARASDSV